MTGIDGWAIYLAIGLLAFSESAALTGLLFPGEAGLVTAGALAAFGGLSIPMLLAVAITASVLGSLVGYAVGWRRPAEVMTWGPVRRRLGAGHTRVLDHLSQRGDLVVVMSRFSPVTRALVPVLAGSAHMILRRFALAVTVGASVWAAVFVGGGYVAGVVWRSGSVIAGVGSGVVAAVIAVLVRRLIRRAPRPEPEAAPSRIPVGAGRSPLPR